MADAPAVAPTAARLDGQLARVTSLLRGTKSHFFQVAVSFASALALCYYGMINSTMDEAARRCFVLCVLFTCSTTFTLGKTLRDNLMASLQCTPHAGFLQPTRLWLVQVWASFLFAVVASFQTLLTSISGSSDDGQWNTDEAFFVMTTGFALAASVGLAKAARDRSDADAFERHLAGLRAAGTDTVATKRQLLDDIHTVVRGTMGGIISITVCFVFATGATVWGTFSMPDVVIERKGFVVMGLMFMTASFFNLAKLIRDLADNELAAQAHLGYRALVFISCAVSFGLSFGGLHYMDIKPEQKRFIGCGMLFVLSTVLSLAKLVRDHQEVKKPHPRAG